MSKRTRPMILRFGTPTLQKDMKRIHNLLKIAGYQKVDEKEDYDHYTHTVEQTLSAKLGLEKVMDNDGKELEERIELILSDADNYVNQTIYNALATVFPREFTE
ncbi:MAG: hypothetical protein FK733_07570 [Asgard group archaeon]|nr:hypothetical protein [Asgard group archaeon]